MKGPGGLPPPQLTPPIPGWSGGSPTTGFEAGSLDQVSRCCQPAPSSAPLCLLTVQPGYLLPVILTALFNFVLQLPNSAIN